MIKVLFFAQVRELVGTDATEVAADFPTVEALRQHMAAQSDRWALGRVTVIHRIGELWPGDEIVFVGVTSAHRSSAFEAGQFIMDYLKTRAPFWKREATPEGDRWVEARESDQQAAKRW